LCGGIERFTGLAILAALSIVAAVLQAAQAIGHLIALGLLAAAVDAAAQGARNWERRRPSSASGHGYERAPQDGPEAARDPVEAPAAASDLALTVQARWVGCGANGARLVARLPENDQARHSSARR